MKKKQREKVEQRKVTDLVRSIVKLYFKKSGRYSVEEINERVDKYIRRVILKPRNNRFLGLASLYEPEIVIYGVDNEPPTFEEIINNLDYYKSTILHEGEHKFFTHRDKNGWITGTGLKKVILENEDLKKWLNKNLSLTNMKKIERFVPNAKELKKRGIDQDILDREIGRGINEGLTEWYRVEVLGNKRDVSYPELTSIIYKLQKHLDRKEKNGNAIIAEYVDGDYDYVFKTLNMSKSTGIAFIRMLDIMYYLAEQKKENKIEDIIKYYELKKKGSLQPGFLARYRKKIESLDIFAKLQEEYKKISYRKESFEEFVAKKGEGKKRVLSRYEKLAMNFLERALERKENSEEMLELSDISDIIDEGAILSAQNMDDIVEGIKISLKSNRQEESAHEELPEEKEKEVEEVELEGSIVGAEQVEEEDLETIEHQNCKEDISQKPQIDREKDIIFSMKSAISKIKFNTKCAVDDIMFRAHLIKERRRNRIGERKWKREHKIEERKWKREHKREERKWKREHKREERKWKREHKRETRKWRREDKRETRKLMKEDRRETRRYYDNTGKLALIGLAAAAGVSIGALTAHLTEEMGNMQDRPNIGVTEPKDTGTKENPFMESKDPQEDIFPFLNSDKTMSLKAGATIYRSIDKVGGRTTLAYDYDNLIIDSVRLIQNNNKVLEVGDLSNLREFMDSLGEEGLSIMMRLGVEQNGEKVYIAWCDYAEMLENAKSMNDREDVEEMEI